MRREAPALQRSRHVSLNPARSRAVRSGAALAAALAVSALISDCKPPWKGTPEIVVSQGSAILGNGSEYVFPQAVIADGEGGICSDDAVLTVANDGGSDLIVEGIALTSGNTADFDLTRPGQTVAVKPGFSATFTVCLDPLTWSPETSAILEITSNDEGNATYVVSLRGFGIRKMLTAADGAAGDELGQSVALSGDTAVVGAEGANAAYVYYRNQGGADNWGLVKKLTGGGRFGHSVAASGDTIVVGSPDAANLEGAVTVFYRNWGGADTWGAVKTCVANDQDGWDNWFGSSLALSGDILVVGARRDTTGYMGNHGSAYVCYRNQGTSDNWGIVKKLLASDRAGNDYFGTSVAISGNTVVVGAPGHTYTSMGAVYVYDRNQGGVDNWGQSREMLAHDGEDGDRLGQSVSVDGDTIVAGADMDDSWRGSAYVFYRDQGGAGNWGEVRKLVNINSAAGSRLGASAAVAGDTLVIGSPGQSGVAGWDGGSIATFSRNQGRPDNWGETRRIAAAGLDAEAVFGSSLAFSNGLLLVGAPYAAIGAASYQGAAFVCDP